MGHWFSSFLTCTVGHPLGEVAHNYVPVLKQWLISAKGIRNPYDSWHGMLLPVHVAIPLLVHSINIVIPCGSMPSGSINFPYCRWKGGEKSYQKARLLTVLFDMQKKVGLLSCQTKVGK